MGEERKTGYSQNSSLKQLGTWYMYSIIALKILLNYISVLEGSALILTIWVLLV